MGLVSGLLKGALAKKLLSRFLGGKSQGTKRY